VTGCSKAVRSGSRYEHGTATYFPGPLRKRRSRRLSRGRKQALVVRATRNRSREPSRGAGIGAWPIPKACKAGLRNGGGAIAVLGGCGVTSPRVRALADWPAGASPAPSGAPRRRAKALYAAAALAAEQGDFDAVSEPCAKSLAIYQELGDKAGQAAVLMGVGFHSTDAAAARPYIEAESRGCDGN
jgi:hypothetical protein